jgi:hypothetical protein
VRKYVSEGAPGSARITSSPPSGGSSVIPLGEPAELKLSFGFFVITIQPFRNQAFFGLPVKQKTPPLAGHLSSAEKEGFEPPVPR